MRIEMFRTILEAMPIWPQKKCVKEMSAELGLPVKSVQDRIAKMSVKYLFSSELVMKTEYYFFPTQRDKTRTLENLQEDGK